MVVLPWAKPRPLIKNTGDAWLCETKEKKIVLVTTYFPQMLLYLEYNKKYISQECLYY